MTRPPDTFRIDKEERDALHHQAVLVVETEGAAIRGAEPIDQANHARHVAVMRELLLQIGWEADGQQGAYLLQEGLMPLRQLAGRLRQGFIPDAAEWAGECGRLGRPRAVRRLKALEAMLQRLEQEQGISRPAPPIAPCGRTEGQLAELIGRAA